MPEDIAALADKINAIASKDYLLLYDGQSTSVETRSRFHEITALEPASLDAVVYAFRQHNSAIEKLLIEVGEPAFKYFDYALKNGDKEVQNFTVQILQKIGKPCWELLKDFLWSDGDDLARSMAARVFASDGAEGLRIINTAIHDDKPDVRLAAVGGMWSIVSDQDQISHENHEGLVKLLNETIRDPDPEIRRRSLSALSRENLPMEEITTALEDKDERVRWEAIPHYFAMVLPTNKRQDFWLERSKILEWQTSIP